LGWGLGRGLALFSDNGNRDKGKGNTFYECQPVGAHIVKHSVYTFTMLNNNTSLLRVVLNASFGISLGEVWESPSPENYMN